MINEIIQAYVGGWTLAKISKFYHTHDWKVLELLRANNIKTRSLKEAVALKNRRRDADIRRFHREGMKPTEIGRLVNISRRQVYRVISAI